MIPLVATEREIEILKRLVDRTAQEVQKKNNFNVDYLVGTMIELPRAAINAKNIAKHADFFSFGTNDLTQTTLGISRDDSGKSWQTVPPSKFGIATRLTPLAVSPLVQTALPSAPLQPTKHTTTARARTPHTWSAHTASTLQASLGLSRQPAQLTLL